MSRLERGSGMLEDGGVKRLCEAKVGGSSSILPTEDGGVDNGEEAGSPTFIAGL